ncbi:zinc finger MYM-type protein 1-like [Salvia hispanica]|uniref:zinc finger MYM-type protein 1-like n=1 Tax=Salvia hispanica TaxID=49212 RepID=UPI0020098CBE|nr:zinc finger MYM-type protein 1-like [Salvia hispanica]
MYRYFKKVSPVAEVSSSSVNEPPLLQPQELPIEDKDKVDLEDEPALLQSQELPNDDNDKVDLEKLPMFQRKLLTAYIAIFSQDFTEMGNMPFDEISSVVLKNAPDNLKLSSPRIQKDIINAFAVETTKVIVQDMGNDFFSILVDECRDISVKEQVGVVVRYVDKNGCVMERFLGVVHVSDTVATSLEKELDSLLSTYDLSVSSLRGQGYDGASNMRGEFNVLKSLILRRNPCAYYVYCFSHQLQLTIVVVAKKHTSIGSFYNTINRLCNVIGSSCKRRDILREKQREKILERIASDEIHTGRGLNQEMALKRPGDTRWSSHYGTLINLMQFFSSINDVFVYVGENAHEYPHRAEANDVSAIINLFEFVFVLHQKGSRIVNAMNLVKVAKARLQMLREEGWEGLLNEVSEFCNKYEINVLDMEDEFVPRGKVNRRAEKRKNLHYYRVGIFCFVINMQAQELNHLFGEINTDLLSCMACFDHRDSFSAFDLEKLLRLASYYPSEFSGVALKELENQLESFIYDVRIDENFSQVFGIGGLAKKMVSTRKLENFPLVYLLVKLSLISPVATASVERAFSAMKIIKSTLRNSMGDQLLHDCLVPYIEKDVFVHVSNETIMQRFQKMKNRREML